MARSPDYVQQVFEKYAKDDRLKRTEYGAFVQDTEGELETVDRQRWAQDCKALGCSPREGINLSAFRRLYEYSQGYTGPTLHIGRAREDLLCELPHHVHATVTLDGEFDDLAGKPGSDTRTTFLRECIHDVANVLNEASGSSVSATELTMLQITSPLVTVHLDIAPCTDGSSVTPADVTTAFCDTVYLPSLGVSTKPGVSVKRHDPIAQLRAIFARIDRNHDRVLTRGELAIRLRDDAELAALLKLPDAESTTLGASRQWTKQFDRIFKQMDTDENRKIDEKEFIQYFSKDYIYSKLQQQTAEVLTPSLLSPTEVIEVSELGPEPEVSTIKSVATTPQAIRQTRRRSKPPPPTRSLPWPPELSELVVVPQVASCLYEIGLGCLDECAFLDHGACTELRIAVERIGPAVQRRKAASALSALLDRVAIFQRWDMNSDGALDYSEVDECVRCSFSRDMLEEQLYNRPGHAQEHGKNEQESSCETPLRREFDIMDQVGDGYLRFSDFFDHCKVGRFFSGLLRASEADGAIRPDSNETPQVGTGKSISTVAHRQSLQSTQEASTHGEWQHEMAQQQETRRRQWAEAQRRSQDFAQKAALAAQTLEPPSSQQTQTTALGRALAAVDLCQYEAGMYAQGYVAIDDLFDADAEELQALEEVLCLRPPERRRLRKMIDSRGKCAPRGRMPPQQGRTGTAAKTQAIGRFLGIAARAAEKEILTQETEHLKAGDNMKAQWYVDEQLRSPTEASKRIIAALTWRAERDEQGKVYYVHKDAKVASTYEKPHDYVAVWQEMPRNIGSAAAEAESERKGRLWCDIVSGEVVVGDTPPQTEPVEEKRQEHEKDLEIDQSQAPAQNVSLGRQPSEQPTEVNGVVTVDLPGQRQYVALMSGTEATSASPALQETETCESNPWTRHEDESSGQPWWRNDETGDETWVRPF